MPIITKKPAKIALYVQFVMYLVIDKPILQATNPAKATAKYIFKSLMVNQVSKTYSEKKSIPKLKEWVIGILNKKSGTRW